MRNGLKIIDIHNHFYSKPWLDYLAERTEAPQFEWTGPTSGVAKIGSLTPSHVDKAGEILVCPYTGTAWTPLFVKIGGAVTDTGGMLTHAAIAAREYGIPAVVGTWNATNSINDGDTIKIDGNVGIVEVIKRAKTA
jgi:pyruvate,water dikinase